MTAENKTSITVKGIFIIFLALILNVPLLFIRDTISDRKTRQDAAVQEVGTKWGGEQSVSGPVIILPYRFEKTVKYLFFIADRLSITGSTTPTERYRGIYRILLYSARLRITGTLGSPQYWKTGVDRADILWHQAGLFIPVSDPLGLQPGTEIFINGKKRDFQQPDTDMGNTISGIMVPLPELRQYTATPIQYSLHLDLKGNRSLQFLPLARETSVYMDSSWKDPSFTGQYLPARERVSEKGFRAEWSIRHFSMPYGFAWDNASTHHRIRQSAFGVEFFIPVNIYQKTERAVKYGLLFIGLTFLAFFLFEVLLGLRIHPFHYLTVGAALCLFFLLFLSLGEHAGFLASYLIAAFAVIGITVRFCGDMLGDRRRGYIIGGLLALLYGYLFILLENESYSLLLGSVGLFLILALVMFLTRNIDWYDPGKKITVSLKRRGKPVS